MCTADVGVNSPIGVFDSGVGGLSVLSELRRTLPREHFIYYGDTAHAPYGTRPKAEILGLVTQVVEDLLQRHIKALVMACNTATAAAAAEIRARYPDLPVIGMEPALKPAHLLRHGGRILVLATPATLSLPKFDHLMARYGEGALRVPCPGLMELVEAGDLAGGVAYVERVLQEQGPDTVDAVVLGCTHYVFLRRRLRKALPAHIALLDGNYGTARQLGRVLEQCGLLRGEGTGGYELLTSGNPQAVLPQMERLLAMAAVETREEVPEA